MTQEPKEIVSETKELNAVVNPAGLVKFENDAIAASGNCKELSKVVCGLCHELKEREQQILNMICDLQKSIESLNRN